MSDENKKNPLIESFLKMHEASLAPRPGQMAGYGGKGDPYQGRNQQRFMNYKDIPKELLVKPEKTHTQPTQSAAPKPTPKPAAAAPTPPKPTPKPTVDTTSIGRPGGDLRPTSVEPKTSTSYGGYSGIPTSTVKTDAAKAVYNKASSAIQSMNAKAPAYKPPTENAPNVNDAKDTSSTEKENNVNNRLDVTDSQSLNNYIGTNQQDLNNPDPTIRARAREAAQRKAQQLLNQETEMSNKLIDGFLKLQATEAPNIFEAAKKAKKDWDKDGKIESEKDEVWGSRMRAAKLAGKLKEAQDPNAEGIAKPGEKAPVMVPKPDYPTSKPGPTRELKGSLPKGVTVKGNTNEEVEELEEKKWIQGAIKHPGALHKQLGVPEGEKIPAGKLAAAAEKGGKLGKRARLAQTLKKMNEEEVEIEESRSALLTQDHADAKNMTPEQKKAKHQKYLKIADEHGKRMKDQSLTPQQRMASSSVHTAAKMAAAEWKNKYMKEEAEITFSEAELAHIASVLEAIAPQGENNTSFAKGGGRTGTLVDETCKSDKKKKMKEEFEELEEGRGRGSGAGRPKGATSGSKYGQGGAGGATHIVDQIRDAAKLGISDGKGNYRLKHVTGYTETKVDGKKVSTPNTMEFHAPQKAANDFYKAYHNTAKPADKETMTKAFVEKHSGKSLTPPKAASKITLPSMPSAKS